MLVVVVGGIFTIVSLVVKALLDMGTPASRARQGLHADLQLLKETPADIKGRGELQEHVETRLAAYLALGIPAETERQTFITSFGSVPRSILVPWSIGLAFAVAASAVNPDNFFALNPFEDASNVQKVFLTISLSLGSLSGVLMVLDVRRMRRVAREIEATH